jgi:menaquinol-cytochrome c reductase iron-sulfur subunit
MATETRHGAGPAAGDDTATLNRRQFLMKLCVGLGGLGAAIVGVPVVGFLLAPLLRRVPEQWQAIGAVDQYQVGTTVLVTLSDPSPLPWAGVAAKTAAWLRRDDEQNFVAFAVNCTHLGCPVRWLQDANLFMCPCHGGVFYNDGKPAAGPPPRPLNRYPVRIRDGQVEVQTIPTRPPEA